MRYFVYRWLPVLLWMGVIFFLSSQPSLPHLPEPLLQRLMSKLAHFAEYAILAALLYRAQSGLPGELARKGLFAFLLSFVYAMGDEFHQSFVPPRNPSPWDVGIDSLGAAATMLVLWLRSRGVGSQKPE